MPGLGLPCFSCSPCAGPWTLLADVALTSSPLRPRGLCRGVRGVVRSFGLAGPSWFPPRFTRAVRKLQAAPPTLHLEISAQRPASPSSPLTSPQRSSSLLFLQRPPCSRFQGRCDRPHQKGLLGRVSPCSLPRATLAFTSTQLRTFQVLPSRSTTARAALLGKVLAPAAPALRPASTRGRCGDACSPGGTAVAPAPGPAGWVCGGGLGEAAGLLEAADSPSPIFQLHSASRVCAPTL